MACSCSFLDGKTLNTFMSAYEFYESIPIYLGLYGPAKDSLGHTGRGNEIWAGDDAVGPTVPD